MSCARCGRSTTAIEMVLGERRAVMRSCLPCETTAWEYNGRPAAFGAVRHAMTETRRTFMRPGRAAA